MNDKPDLYAEALEVLILGIEGQEKAGQTRFVNSERLPRQTASYRDNDTRAIYEALGIEVIAPADDLFYNVKLPEGWQKIATDHSMWSKLIDDQGRERGMMFYKAAFYDRSAHFSLTAVQE